MPYASLVALFALFHDATRNHHVRWQTLQVKTSLFARRSQTCGSLGGKKLTLESLWHIR